MVVAEFALLFDGYSYRGNFADLADWANEHQRTFAASGSLAEDLSLDDTRALLFFEQRRWRHLDDDPDGEAWEYIDVLLGAIRSRAGEPRG